MTEYESFLHRQYINLELAKAKADAKESSTKWLNVSEKTVRNHISDMLLKTDAGSRDKLFGMARDGHIAQKSV